nr:hypothetical protein [Tanacetum cinerariifolium]
MDDFNITMEEYIRIEEEKARRRGKVYNWETATYGKIWYDEDVHDLRSVETEFSAIVFNDTLTSKVALSCEPTVCPLNDNQFNVRISFDKSDDENYTVIKMKEMLNGKFFNFGWDTFLINFYSLLEDKYDSSGGIFDDIK